MNKINLSWNLLFLLLRFYCADTMGKEVKSLEIRQLEYFRMVSEVNSFTRAAERLYVSQPAVTNAIRSLEEELGIQLFDRSQKQVVLTAEGQIFYRHVERILHGITTTLTEIDALRNLSDGTLRLGITAMGGVRPIISLLKIFRESYPNIRMVFHEADTEHLQRALLEDRLDGAFLFHDAEAPALSYLSLQKQEIVFCCERHHLLRRKNSIALEQLREEHLLLPEEGSFIRSVLNQAFTDAGISAKAVFSCSQVTLLQRMTAAGIGVTFLPECLVDRTDDLACVALDPPLFVSPAYAWHTSRHPSYAAQAFLETVRKEEAQ